MGWGDRLRRKQSQPEPENSGGEMFAATVTIKLSKLRREMKGPALQPVVRNPVGQVFESNGEGPTASLAIAGAFAEIGAAIGDGFGGAALANYFHAPNERLEEES